MAVLHKTRSSVKFSLYIFNPGSRVAVSRALFCLAFSGSVSKSQVAQHLRNLGEGGPLLRVLTERERQRTNNTTCEQGRTCAQQRWIMLT